MSGTVAVMADDTFTIERSTMIEAPPERVYEQIADFHNWPNWSPWEGMDPQMQRTYSGAEAGTGSKYAWSGSRKVGQGSMEITDTTEPSRIDIDLTFEKPWKAHNTTTFSIGREASGSRVTWSMTGENTAVTKLMGLFKSMDKMVGPDFEKGLARLKATAEQSAA